MLTGFLSFSDGLSIVDIWSFALFCVVEDVLKLVLCDDFRGYQILLDFRNSCFGAEAFANESKDRSIAHHVPLQLVGSSERGQILLRHASSSWKDNLKKNWPHHIIFFFDLKRIWSS
jgi:hypothetical protein